MNRDLFAKTGRTIRILGALAWSVAAASHGAVVAGTELNIGSSNTISTTSGNWSGAVGTQNTLYNSSSLAVGYHNNINGNGAQSLAVGSSNFVGAPNSLAIGTSNNFGFDYEFGSGDSSLIVGLNNGNWGVASLVVGQYSMIPLRTGGDGFSIGLPWGAVAFGLGVSNPYDHSLVVGKYNAIYDALPDLGPAPLFLIGNGTGITRSNALEVWEDGRIKMGRQGDILMGEFGNP